MQLPLESEYIVIGDVHGCIDELKQLIIQNGFTIDKRGLIDASSTNKSIILLGDFIDKNSHQKIAETIEFIHQNYTYLNKNYRRFYLIMGNHEDKVYSYITNDNTLEITARAIEEKEKYYNTVALLENNSTLKKKFLELYDNCFYWLKYNYSSEFSVILTHAPCEEKYLCRADKKSQKKMIKSISRSKNPGIPLDKLIPFVHQEASDNRHYHIFAHLSQPNIRVYKNRVCIDTSAVYGESLSCVLIKADKLSFDSTPYQSGENSTSQIYNILFDF